jgi:hypothetical protein
MQLITTQVNGITFSTNGANERLRITNDAYLRMASGSGGIQFNGDTAAANALDDYEQGDHTPILSFGGASVGITYNAATMATYTKIGRLVTYTAYVQLTSKGSSNGQASVSLPISARSGDRGIASGSISVLENITFANVPTIRSFTTDAYFGEMTEAGGFTDLTDADFANNSGFRITVTYETA